MIMNKPNALFCVLLSTFLAPILLKFLMIVSNNLINYHPWNFWKFLMKCLFWCIPSSTFCVKSSFLTVGHTLKFFIMNIRPFFIESSIPFTHISIIHYTFTINTSTSCWWISAELTLGAFNNQITDHTSLSVRLLINITTNKALKMTQKHLQRCDYVMAALWGISQVRLALSGRLWQPVRTGCAISSYLTNPCIFTWNIIPCTSSWNKQIKIS